MLENIDRRKLIIGGLIALLVIIIALILWWLFGPKAAAPPVVAPPTQPLTSDQVVAPAALPPVSAERQQADSSYPLGLKQLAMAFAERYGSYSTDEPVKNMADLEPLMTPRFRDTYVAPDNGQDAAVFSGFSTKAISSALVSSSGNSAVVTVTTQRTQTLGAGSVAKTFYADLELSAVVSNGEWKIDNATWR